VSRPEPPARRSSSGVHAAASARHAPVERADAQLVQAALAGDRGALEALYRRHVQTVYARLTRLVGFSPEREDLVQQVFFRFHRALPRYRGEAPLGAFLHGILVHVAYEALRRRRSPLARFTSAELDTLVAQSASPETRAHQREQLARVFSLLDQLKPKKRIAFVLHVVEGLSVNEVAELTRAEPRAAGQRIAYARRELLELLARAERNDAGGTR